MAKREIENEGWPAEVWVPIVIGGIIIAAILIFGCFYIVDPGERAVLITLGNPSPEPRTEGLHFKLPLVQSVEIMDIKTQVVRFDNEQGKGDVTEHSSLFAASKDLQDVQIATIVNFHLNGPDVVYIYQNYGTQDYYIEGIISPIIRETVKSISAKYAAEELVTKRIEFSNEVAKALEERIGQKHGTMERFNVVNFQFSDEFTKAIEAKVTAIQLKQKAENDLERIKVEAEQKIAAAGAEAEALRLQKQQITPDLIELRRMENMKLAIEKWNGIMPQTMAASLPFIDVTPQ